MACNQQLGKALRLAHLLEALVDAGGVGGEPTAVGQQTSEITAFLRVRCQETDQLLLD